jgi:hypothetical protein
MPLKQWLEHGHTSQGYTMSWSLNISASWQKTHFIFMEHTPDADSHIFSYVEGKEVKKLMRGINMMTMMMVLNALYTITKLTQESRISHDCNHDSRTAILNCFLSSGFYLVNLTSLTTTRSSISLVTDTQYNGPGTCCLLDWGGGVIIGSTNSSTCM